MVSGPTVSTEAEPVDDDLSEVLWLLWLLYAPGLLPPWPPLAGAAVQSEADCTDWCESESLSASCSPPLLPPPPRSPPPPLPFDTFRKWCPRRLKFHLKILTSIFKFAE